MGNHYKTHLILVGTSLGRQAAQGLTPYIGHEIN